jgi:hypothetical protein
MYKTKQDTKAKVIASNLFRVEYEVHLSTHMDKIILYNLVYGCTHLERKLV